MYRGSHDRREMRSHDGWIDLDVFWFGALLRDLLRDRDHLLHSFFADEPLDPLYFLAEKLDLGLVLRLYCPLRKDFNDLFLYVLRHPLQMLMSPCMDSMSERSSCLSEFRLGID